MRFEQLSHEHINLLSDDSALNSDIAETLNVGLATISRWRKKLGITITQGRKSKENGGRYTKHGMYHPCPTCGVKVYHMPSDSIGKHCSRECMWLNPDYLKKIAECDRSHIGGEGWSKWLIKADVPQYIKYKNLVHRLTEKVYRANIDKLNPHRHPRTLCGVEGGWQLDHIKAVRQCFDEGLSAEQASDINNLRMLPWEDNLMRNYN